MRLLQLKYFETVAKYENMTKAATELCIAQPAISQSISRLENDLGVELFIREGKRIRLSACGILLYNRISSVLSDLDNIKLELTELAGDQIQHINLKVMSASMLVPGMLAEFKQMYPQISFTLIQDPKEMGYDLCINSTPSVNYQGGTVLLDEEIFLAVPDSYPKLGRNTVSLFEYRNADFISLNKGAVLRSIMDYYCHRLKFTPKISFESDNPAMVRGLIKAGVGVAFWPIKSWGPLKNYSANALHISDINTRRVITIDPPGGKPVSGTSQLFVNFTKEFFNKLIR